MSDLTPKDIVRQLIEAREAYYNSDTPLMTDAAFDSLEERLKAIDPENNYFITIGSIEKQGKKIKHVIPLLSMAKAKTLAETYKWIDKLHLPNESFIIEPKIDGLSATCKYKNEKLDYVATRGDGFIGQDVSHLAQYLDDIKMDVKELGDDIEIRGELYLPKNTSLETGGRPLRNICVGLVNRKDEQHDLAHVRFAAYQIIGSTELVYESEKIEALKQRGFHVVEYIVATSTNEIETYHNEYINVLRNKWLYETDGLIVSLNNAALFEEVDSRWTINNHHHYALALKPPAEYKETELLDIMWQVSRQGNVVPVALFQPVIIGGAHLSRATLHNYETVEKLHLQKGNTLLIERANDVIPYVKENVDYDEKTLTGDDLLPEKCPSCEKELYANGVHRQCRNESCEEKNIQQIIYWVKKSGVEQVAEASIRMLYKIGKARSIKDLYLLKEEDFEGVEGFAEKKIQNFISEFKDARFMSAIDFIGKLGIPLVQKKALKRLGINTIEDFLQFNDDSYVVGGHIIDWKKDLTNMKLFNELLEVVTIMEDDRSITKGKVCMTGKGPKSRNELIQIIESKGYEFVKTITKDVDILICEDIQGKSSKLDKARKNGTTLISYDEFFADQF